MIRDEHTKNTDTDCNKHRKQPTMKAIQHIFENEPAQTVLCETVKQQAKEQEATERQEKGERAAFGMDTLQQS